ncbi:MAG: response regulator transcription factor [Acidobacteriota bacterium]
MVDASLKRSIVLYGVAIALAAGLLQWLDVRHHFRLLSTELYILVIAAGFTALGIWMGHRLTRRPAPAAFEKNAEALSYLGISEREHEVLELLADGHSNGEIAKQLHVSPNTVKTHLSRLYEKLEVSRRTQAVSKARSLRLIP